VHFAILMFFVFSLISDWTQILAKLSRFAESEDNFAKCLRAAVFSSCCPQSSQMSETVAESF